MVGKNYYKKYKIRTTRDKQKALDEYKGKNQKFIVLDVYTGKQICAITLSRGRIAIGDDVWRLSNKADTCEYPFRIVDEYEFAMFYQKIETASYPLPYKEDEDAKIARAV